MPLRIGVVGTGPRQRTVQRGGGFAIGRIHAEAWKRIDGTVMAAACDINSENLNAYCSDYSIEGRFTDFESMLSDSELDFVSICTWPVLHANMVVSAAESGVKGIYCEKPMCVSLGEADRMLDACQANGTKIAVSHQRRFEPTYLAAKKIVSDGKLGKIAEMNARISVADADLLSWGTHWIDQMSFFMDDRHPASVLAQIDTTQQITRYGHRVENDSLVQVVYDDGVTFVLEGANDLPAPYFRVVGDRGFLTVTSKLLAWWQEGDAVRSHELPRGQSDFLDSYVAAIGDLVESVDQNRPPKLDGFRSRLTTEIIMAAYESANCGKRIQLPFEDSGFPLMNRHYGDQ